MSYGCSDVYHIASAAQRSTERDAVFWFVPQQTGGTAHRRERGGFPVCTATNWWCSPAISDTSKKRSAYSSKRKPRKEEEPSSTAAHSPQAHLHRTRARTHFFCMDACPHPRKMRPLCGAARGGWGAYRCLYMVRGAYLALGRPRRPRRGTSG